MKSQTAKDKAPPDEGLELVDGDGEDLDVDYLEDLEDDSQENEEGTDGDEQGTNYENTNLVENLECEDDNMPISNNTEVINTNDLQLLQRKSMALFCHMQKECSNTLLPFLVQIEGVTATEESCLKMRHILMVLSKKYCQKLHLVQRYHKKMEKNTTMKRTVLICLIDCV